MTKLLQILLFLISSLSVSAGTIHNGDFSSDAGWTVSSTNFGTPWCDFATCGSGEGTVGPHSGAGWMWFGGTSNEETASASQQVTLDPTDRFLSFWVWAGAVPSTNDYFRVMIDSTTVFSLTLGNSASYSRYQQVFASLAPWADGNQHTISFVSYNPAHANSFNVSLDDVALANSSPVPEPASMLLIGSGVLALAYFRRLRAA